MKRALPLLLLLVVLAGCTALPVDPGAQPTSPAPSESGVDATVVEVVDGDTVDVRYPNGTTDTVRLLGLDTPEVHTANTAGEFEGVPDTDAGRACLRTAGHEASEYANASLFHEEVRLVTDPLADRRGDYGRLLAYVYLDGENVNYDLVAEGYARVYDSDFTESERFYEAETAARSSGTGVWRCTDPGSMDTTPATDSALAVAAVHADAAGDDHENPNGEYVVLENRGNESLALGGWTITDEAAHVYTFPEGFALAPAATVTVYSGTGSDSATDLYWGLDSAVWNNGGDTVFVYDKSGELRVERGYG